MAAVAAGPPLAGSRSGSGLTPAGLTRFKCHCKDTLACLRRRRPRGLVGGAWACSGAVPQSLWFLAMTLMALLTQARALLSATRNPPPRKSGTSSNLISGSGLLNSTRLKQLNGEVAMDTEAEGGTNFPTSFGQSAVVALLFGGRETVCYISHRLLMPLLDGLKVPAVLYSGFHLGAKIGQDLERSTAKLSTALYILGTCAILAYIVTVIVCMAYVFRK